MRHDVAPQAGLRARRWLTLAGLAAVAVLWAGGCTAGTPPPATVAPASLVRALLQGQPTPSGCRADRDCAPPGATVHGLCTMGTCFGLLTVDAAPARTVLTDRLRRAPPPVRATAQASLLAALASWDGSGTAKQGAIAGLGALLAADPALLTPCGPACAALQAEAAAVDPRRAVSARLALGRAGFAPVGPELVEDARFGTELLRADAVDALAGLTRGSGPVAMEARACLIAALADTSAVVQDAAVRGLAPLAAGSPAIAGALKAARERQPHRVGYAVDRALAAPP